MRAHKRHRIADPDLEAQTIAWLLCEGKPEDEPNQTTIANRLRISQAEVSRLKSRAEERGWLVTTKKCNLTLEQSRRVRERLYPVSGTLRKWLETLNPEPGLKPIDVSVFDSGGEDTDTRGYHSRLEEFGAQAAGRLGELLPGMSVVGVTWGRTVSCLVKSLATARPERPDGAVAIQFVPLSGVLLSDPNITLSSTSLVALLHEIVNQRLDGALSFGAVPARLPAFFSSTNKPVTPSERRTLELFIESIPGYREVFGTKADKTDGKQPLVERIDSLITSVGCDYSRSGDPWLEEMIRNEHLSKEELDRFAVGDIGGIFLPRDELRTEERKKLADINSRWRGASLDHIRRCALDAASGRRPGVILIAIGKRKVDVVLECVKQRLVNQLVIGLDLAQALAEHDFVSQ